jgi:hypothetical protein
MDGSNLQGVQQMGFTIHSYFGGSNSPDSAADPSTAWPQAMQRIRWGIRASAVSDCGSAEHKAGGGDTQATNRSASMATVETLIAAVTEVAARSELRAESPGGFTAPGASRSQSAYDLAPLILSKG